MPECPRKRSFMTPCFIEDGPIALADVGVCVGCGYLPSATTESSPPINPITEAIPEELLTCDEIVLTALRTACGRLFAMVDAEQQAFFIKIYRGKPDTLDEERLRSAIPVCQRTIAKNRKKAANAKT